MVDVGDHGCHNDAGVLAQSTFSQALDSNSLSLSPLKPLPGTAQPAMPFVIVGNEAFPFKQNMLRPFPGRNLPETQAVFNYRLSRARCIIENSFSILAARW